MHFCSVLLQYTKKVLRHVIIQSLTFKKGKSVNDKSKKLYFFNTSVKYTCEILRLHSISNHYITEELYEGDSFVINFLVLPVQSYTTHNLKAHHANLGLVIMTPA